jgi:EAL domain-containing protein (putative c-di-GMP-specific phosphodiesterase class I)
VKKYGVKIAIDDFGAGYSNFVYITKLDIDYIKIDGSIIRTIDTNITSQIITKTIIDFASQLNIQTIAEFVCNEDVFNYVKHLPLTHLQGYYFGEPSPKIITLF